MASSECFSAKNLFSEWLDTEDSLAFRNWCFETSKKFYQETKQKGFMTIEFDTAEEAVAYVTIGSEKDGAYTIIAESGIPPAFKKIYDQAELEHSFLLYVVFGKKMPSCISMLKNIVM